MRLKARGEKECIYKALFSLMKLRRLAQLKRQLEAKTGLSRQVQIFKQMKSITIKATIAQQQMQIGALSQKLCENGVRMEDV